MDEDQYLFSKIAEYVIKIRENLINLSRKVFHELCLLPKDARVM